MSEASEKKRWDCHECRNELCISYFNTIYHPEHGQLCQAEKHWDGILFHPFHFGSKQAAQKWIETGFIAELQEDLSNLGVGFTTVCFKAREI